MVSQRNRSARRENPPLAVVTPTHEEDRDKLEEILPTDDFDLVAIEGELPTLVATLSCFGTNSPGMRLIPVVGIPSVHRGRKLDEERFLDVVRLWSSAD